MGKRNRAEAALPMNGGSRAKRRKDEDDVPVSSEYVHADSDEEESGERDFVRTQGLRIWQEIKDASQDNPYRLLSSLFLVQPDRKMYPDYYDFISQPIALSDIKHKLNAHGYSSLDAVKQDFDLCFDNAQQYNHPDSEIFHDAKDLQKRVHKLFKAVRPPADRTTGDKKNKPSMRRTLKPLLQNLTSLTDSSGRLYSQLFMELPDPLQWASYYQTIKQPQCFNNIFKRLKHKHYASATDFADDVELVFSNCFQFNLEHAAIWEDAVVLQKHFRQLMSELQPPFAVERYARPSGPKIKLKLPVAASSVSAPPAPKAIVIPPKSEPVAESVVTQPKLSSASTTKAKSTLPMATSKSLVPKASGSSITSVKQPPPKAAKVEPKALRSAPVKPAVTAVVTASQTVVKDIKQTPATSSQPVAPLPPTATFSQYSIPVHAPTPVGPLAAPASASAPTASVKTRSQGAALTQQAQQVKKQPRSPAPPPAHLLDFIRLKSVPRGRPFVLHHRDGVKSWMIRLGPEEQELTVSDITYLHNDAEEYSSGEEDGMDVDEPSTRPKRGRGRPTKAVTRAMQKKKPKLNEVQVKLNGSLKEGDKGQWSIPVPLGNNTLEVGEKGGLMWKIYTQRGV